MAEAWLDRWVNQPLLNRVVPEWIHPNWISIGNAVVCLVATALACAGSELESAARHGWALALRLIMSLLIFVSTSLDCLDGMQARKTRRCSRVGEALDHCVDSLTIPLLATAGLTTMSHGASAHSPMLLCFCTISATLVFYTQLRLHRQSGKMILPPINGPQAQMMVSANLAVVACLLYAFDRETHVWLQVTCPLATFVGCYIQAKNCGFFFERLTRNHLVPVLQVTATLLLHAVIVAFATQQANEEPHRRFQIIYLGTFTSLAMRINARLVLGTLTSRPFGFDTWLFTLVCAWVGGTFLLGSSNFVSLCILLMGALSLFTQTAFDFYRAVPLLAAQQG